MPGWLRVMARPAQGCPLPSSRGRARAAPGWATSSSGDRSRAWPAPSLAMWPTPSLTSGGATSPTLSGLTSIRTVPSCRATPPSSTRMMAPTHCMAARMRSSMSAGTVSGPRRSRQPSGWLPVGPSRPVPSWGAPTLSRASPPSPGWCLRTLLRLPSNRGRNRSFRVWWSAPGRRCCRGSEGTPCRSTCCPCSSCPSRRRARPRGRSCSCCCTAAWPPPMPSPTHSAWRS
mmetsp:Transcript_145057/g.404099  ORF Transcript_145057/g.404099 Transcript_145057/m.404099 type:complete len:230 (-) Transcript_145057:2101-2790(-)